MANHTTNPKAPDGAQAGPLAEAGRTERSKLLSQYAVKLTRSEELTRSLVSFQANKNVPIYRWFKYREGFSSELVELLLRKFAPSGGGHGRVLDPFAGAGTTLSTAARLGWKAVGIELLPVGAAVIKAHLAADRVDLDAFEACLGAWRNGRGKRLAARYTFPHLTITRKAFAREAEMGMGSYLRFVDSIRDQWVRQLFWFGCLAVLEGISFTQKDGQYLRWDIRSGRPLKSKKRFQKQGIADFETAIDAKLQLMLEDLAQRKPGEAPTAVQLLEGSCLSILPRLTDEQFDCILTSPPYCNRYDYTRTYALELAFMGCDEDAVKALRQELLSCTVENRCKRDELRTVYQRGPRPDLFARAERAFESQAALQEVLGLLRQKRAAEQLNNPKIPNLVENYFFEMSLVIHEFGRVLAPGGHVLMVNDNVQYSGEEVPVDLILSEFAAHAGLEVDAIWVLPKGKGNSSQQMGAHGRTEVRKCIYVWRKASPC